MSKSEGKGSILLKLLILVLIVGLVLVIIIPGKIWEQEKYELTTERTNLVSIYEAERFYYRLTKSYTDDPQEALTVIHSDSTLQIENAVVNNTRQLKRTIAAYLNNKFIKEILNIDLNMTTIISDLESNVRNFKDHEEILNESEELRIKINELRTASNYTDFIFCALYLDTLSQLNRDITDYTLQVGATMALYYADTISSALPRINVTGFENKWLPLSTRLDGLIMKVLRSDITKLTSVADRVKDFKRSTNRSFSTIKTLSVDTEVSNALNIIDKLEDLSNDFLQNYLITSKMALVRMPEADSLVLNLTHDKFESPINKQPIKIFLLDDSSAVKVESPVLLDELKEKSLPAAEKVGNLDFVPAFRTYLDSMESIQEKALAIRRQLRKNTDLFIGYKYIEEIIKNQFPKLQIYSSYNDLNKMAVTIPKSESYSEITDNLENSLSALSIIRQLLQQKIYGNLDTLHLDLVNAMIEFNDILASVRRLPKDIQNLEGDIENLHVLLQSIKSSDSETQLTQMQTLKTEIGEHLEFAETGTEETMYGIFKKKIVNPGYIYQDVKSWEEDE